MKTEDKAKVKELIKHYISKDNATAKTVYLDILNNIVNNQYVRSSNQFVDLAWDEFNKVYTS